MLSNNQARVRGRSNIELKSGLPFYSRAIVGSCNGAVLQWPIKALTRLVGAFKAADPSEILLDPAIANAYDAVLARSCSPTAASLPLLSLFDLRAYDLDAASTTELRKHRQIHHFGSAIHILSLDQNRRRSQLFLSQDHPAGPLAIPLSDLPTSSCLSYRRYHQSTKALSLQLSLESKPAVVTYPASKIRSSYGHLPLLQFIMSGRRRRASTSSVETIDGDKIRWLQESSVVRSQPKDVSKDDYPCFELRDATVYDRKGEALENALNVVVRGPYIVRGHLIIDDPSQKTHRELRPSTLSLPRSLSHQR